MFLHDTTIFQYKNYALFVIFFAAFCLFAIKAEAAVPVAVQTAPVPVDISRMEQEVEALRRMARNEADTTLQSVAQDKSSLLRAVEQLRTRKKQQEAKLAALEALFTQQQQTLIQLEQDQAEQKSSSQTLEGAVRLTAGKLRERFSKSPYTSTNPQQQEHVAHLANSDKYPDYEDIRALSRMLFAEIDNARAVSLQPGEYSLPDGSVARADILRVGHFLAAARNESGEIVLVQPADSGKRLMLSPAKAQGTILENLENLFAGQGGRVPADFSGGAVLRRFTEEKNWFDHIRAGGFLVWPILLLGGGAMLFGIWRYAVLSRVLMGDPRVLGTFFEQTRREDFISARETLDRQATNDKAPVYDVLRHMLDNWNGTITSLEKCHDEAILAHLTPLERGITFVAVAAAVSPLLGLLGTVTGMIATFDSITLFGNSDPKMLSGGISIALVTTELGLLMAIPLMLLHYVLSRRVDALGSDMEEQGVVFIARASGKAASGCGCACGHAH